VETSGSVTDNASSIVAAGEFRWAPPARKNNAVAPLRMRAVLPRAVSCFYSRPACRARRVCASARDMASLSAADARRAVDLFTLCENLKARHPAHAVCSAARVSARAVGNRPRWRLFAAAVQRVAPRRSLLALPVLCRTRTASSRRGAPDTRIGPRKLAAQRMTQPLCAAHAAHGLGARRRAQAGVHRRPHVPHGAPPTPFPLKPRCARSFSRNTADSLLRPSAFRRSWRLLRAASPAWTAPSA